jgi:hypothetical protein
VHSFSFYFYYFSTCSGIAFLRFFGWHITLSLIPLTPWFDLLTLNPSIPFQSQYPAFISRLVYLIYDLANFCDIFSNAFALYSIAFESRFFRISLLLRFICCLLVGSSTLSLGSQILERIFSRFYGFFNDFLINLALQFPVLNLVSGLSFLSPVWLYLLWIYCPCFHWSDTSSYRFSTIIRLWFGFDSRILFFLSHCTSQVNG